MGYRLDDKNIKFTGKLVSTGKTGNVYHYHDMALKEFKDDKKTPIDEETARYLTNISTDRILLPRNLLFYNNKFRGYTYRLIKGPNKKIITISKKDLIQDIRVLEKDINTLSNESVLLSGVSPENSIFNGELYLTDPSNYTILEDINTPNLEQLNNYQLHLLLVKLITTDLRSIKFATKAKIDAIEAILKGKDLDEESSDFFNDLIGKNDTIKQFVKKI